MDMVTYDRKSQMGHNLIQTYFQALNIPFSNTTKDGTMLYFTYQTLDTEVSQKVKILNFPGFISAVGGNLGLFIGFSFLQSLFILLQLICTQLNGRARTKSFP